MFRKQVLTSVLAILCIVAVTVMVYAHCHDTVDCEDVFSDLITGIRWQDSAIPVNYLINDTSQPNMPSLLPDVVTAGATWSNIEFNNSVIPFSVHNSGLTTALAGADDNKNVVGWTCELPWNDEEKVLAVCRPWLYTSTYIFRQADILVNYYVPYHKHEGCPSNKFCILDMMTHEFGHFAAGFHDLSTADNCSAQYKHYTMWVKIYGPNKHNKEDLTCEDQYSLWYTYENY